MYVESKLLEKLGLSHLRDVDEIIPEKEPAVEIMEAKPDSEHQKSQDSRMTEDDDDETILCSWEETQRQIEVEVNEAQKGEETLTTDLELENFDNFDMDNSFDVLEGMGFDLSDDGFHDV